MSSSKQELVQEERYLTLEDIAPTWKKALDNPDGLTEAEWLTLEHSPEMCIVGEAWGFTRRYEYGGPDDCEDCCCYSGAIPALNRDIEDRDKYIRYFVTHWNRNHRDVTERNKQVSKV